VTISDETAALLLSAGRRRAAGGDAAGAIVLLDELIGARPRHRDALLLVGRLHLPGDPAAAAGAMRVLIGADPRDKDALVLLGQALSAAGRHNEALLVFRDVAALWPLDSSAHANLALALVRAGDPHAAIASAEQAVALEPGRAEAHANRGHGLNVLRRSDEALAAFAEALRLRPDFTDALVGLARAQRDLGQLSLAATALRRAVRSDPGAVGPSAELATLLHDLGDLEGARQAHRRALAKAPALAHFQSNVLLHMQYDPDVDETAAARAACDWGVRQVAAVRPTAIAVSPGDPDRTLRIGYVSADFYRHPVGWLGAAPIIAHDRSAVHVTLYANQTATDDVTERFRAAADAWVPVLGLDDESLAARIAADRIDILVDLAGHTAGNRLAVFARRPAPIQVAWLGYFATTGLPTMDAVLLDGDHLAPGAEALFLERVIRLPRVRFCYSPPPDAPAPDQTPPRERTVTFGSFNNAAKLNDAVIALWSRILLGAPSSSLLLKWRSLVDPGLQVRLRDRFARHRVDPARIRFDGATPHGEMLRQYGDIDVALDPFPFCGGLTTCEALFMGVPVVTLPGRRPVSRQSHAILRAVGRPEWSARDEDHYVEIALTLAHDPALRRALRQSLRGELGASPLCDGAGFARDLEHVYRDLWRRRCGAA